MNLNDLDFDVENLIEWKDGESYSGVPAVINSVAVKTDKNDSNYLEIKLTCQDDYEGLFAKINLNPTNVYARKTFAKLAQALDFDPSSRDYESLVGRVVLLDGKGEDQGEYGVNLRISFFTSVDAADVL